MYKYRFNKLDEEKIEKWKLETLGISFLGLENLEHFDGFGARGQCAGEKLNIGKERRGDKPQPAWATAQKKELTRG